jgi:hypothetical protein
MHCFLGSSVSRELAINQIEQKLAQFIFKLRTFSYDSLGLFEWAPIGAYRLPLNFTLKTKHSALKMNSA